MSKHVLMRGSGNWVCLRCRKTGEKWWIDAQPCLEAAPAGPGRTPIVCVTTTGVSELLEDACPTAMPRLLYPR